MDAPNPGRYRPIMALPYWDVIGPFVTSIVEDTAVALACPPRVLYAVVTPFVLWCWQSRGKELDRRRIFTITTIDEFISLGMSGYANGSRGTWRARLLQIGQALPQSPITARRLRPIPRSAPTTPYTRAEIASLSAWATTQHTPARRRDARMLLALGLGAGLSATEILHVQVADVLTGEDLTEGVVQVRVRSARQRIVPVRDPWAGVLRRELDTAIPTGWVFRPGRDSAAANQITDFLTRHRTRLEIRPARMRTTWLLEHLTAGTPAQELLRIAGLRNFAALDRICRLQPGEPGLS